MTFHVQDRDVHAKTIAEIGDIDQKRYRKVTLTERDERQYEKWKYFSLRAAEVSVPVNLNSDLPSPENRICFMFCFSGGTSPGFGT